MNSQIKKACSSPKNCLLFCFYSNIITLDGVISIKFQTLINFANINESMLLMYDFLKSRNDRNILSIAENNTGIKKSKNTNKNHKDAINNGPSLARFRWQSRARRVAQPCFRCFANFLAAQFARSSELPRDKQH